MRVLAVESPGPRTTVEDLGRRMVARFGVPAGGAFDALSLVAANRLVGNADGAAGLEATLAGPTLVNEGEGDVALALVGGAPEARVDRRAARERPREAGETPGAAHAVEDREDEPAPPGRVLVLGPGDRLVVGTLGPAARAWIAVAGGIAVPDVLGSRSTCLAAGFGGFAGRALARGDRVPLGAPGAPRRSDAWREPLVEDEAAPYVLRFVRGPQWTRFGEDGVAALRATAWRVQRDSDRTGVRLGPVAGGDADASALTGVAGIAPEGTTLGAVQVPPDGCPIVLGPDRPVTGGYAKPAVVAAADVARLARLRPGDVVRFAEVTLDEACALATARRARLARLLG